MDLMGILELFIVICLALAGFCATMALIIVFKNKEHQ